MQLKNLATFGVGSVLLAATTLLAVNEPTPDVMPDVSTGLTPDSDKNGTPMRSALERAFIEANPGVRIGQWANSKRIYGRAFCKGDSPVDAAERFCDEHLSMLGVEPAHLKPSVSRWREQGHVQPVMFDMATGSYKFTAVYYEQEVDGIHVYGSRLTVLVRNQTNEVVMVNPDTRDIGAFRPGPDVGVEPRLAPGAKMRLRGQFGNLAITRPERTVIWGGDSPNTKIPARLATESIVVVGPEKYRVLTCVETGEILHTEDLICFFGGDGQVTGFVTDGIGSEQCEEEVPIGLPYLEVTSGGNSTFTDANGNFVLPGGALTTEAALVGQWFEIFNWVGPVDSESTTSSPPDIVFNASNLDPLVRAQVNAYFESNRVRDFTLVYNPAYPGLGINQFPVTVNRTDGFCPGNAWFDSVDNGGQGSINFCQEGGGFPNTAWSSVVMHEYGHNLVNKAGSGQGQYGEGMSDCVQSLILDTNLLGLGFFGSCDPQDALRDPVANFRTFPCSGGIHDCGQLLSGCVWDFLTAMKSVDPVNAMDIVANLTINSILLHSGSGIDPSITTDFLTLDDDDGDLSNGTPNEAQILAGFEPHNMGPIEAPTNDDCEDATEICAGESISGTLIGTTNDGAAGCGDSSSASDAWFVYQAAANGDLNASLCGATNYDSVISIHTDCPGNASNQIACDDDGCGSTGGPSQVTIPVTAGQTYYIRVSGWQGSTGNYTLTVTGPDCEPLVPPALNIALPDGVPMTLEPGVATTMLVEITPGEEAYDDGSGELRYRDNGGSFQSVPLVPLGGSQFEATLPASECDRLPEFYVRAAGTLGTVVTMPPDAPSSVFSAEVGVRTAMLADDFENDLGWTTSSNGATSGEWQRGLPVNDPGWDYDPPVDGDGSGRAYFTQNQPGNTDVDDGSVTLTSPTIDMSGDGTHSVRYEYFLRLTNDDGADRLLVEANSNDGGGAWTTVANHTTNGGLEWRSHEITEAELVDAGVSLTSTMRFRFTVNDGDPQSIVEAGLDGFIVDTFECEATSVALCPWDCAPDNGDGTFGNGFINVDDLFAVINAFNGSGPCDVEPDNGDGTFGNGIVNVDDLFAVLNRFGACPE